MNTSKKNKLLGYTLIESLIVLLVISIFATLPVVVLPRLKEKLEVYQFLNQFEKYTLLTQQVAILSNQFTGISRAADNQNQIVFSLEYEKNIILTLPKELRVSSFRSKNFYKNTGNIDRLENIRFTWKTENKWIDYTFLLGKGHYDKTIKPIK